MIHHCRYCGAQVRWVVSAKNHRPQILNFRAVVSDGTRKTSRLVTEAGTVISKAAIGTVGYIDHHATCKGNYVRKTKVAKPVSYNTMGC